MTTENVPRAVSAPDVAVGDEGPTTVLENVSREDIVRYAGASGDFNPVHYDDELARSKGNKSVFAQGMFTAGVATRTLQEWFGLQSLKSYRTRFVSKVWPGDTLTVTAVVDDVSEDDEVAVVSVDVAVENQDGETVVTGEATVELPIEEPERER